jgi:hypothetical protein
MPPLDACFLVTGGAVIAVAVSIVVNVDTRRRERSIARERAHIDEARRLLDAHLVEAKAHNVAGLRLGRWISGRATRDR